jgi:TatD DNase family protein
LDQALKHHRADPRLVAVGEIGLDGFVPGLDMALQQHHYQAQLKLAQRFDLPVILHVRRSADLLLKGLRQTPVKGGIAHAFNGSPVPARAFVDLGFALGFGGAMTYTRALQIRRLVVDMPGEAQVLETDAPDIAPAWLHPGRNEPAQLARIAEVCAELRGESPQAAIARTGANACRVLPRLAAFAAP